MSRRKRVLKYVVTLTVLVVLLPFWVVITLVVLPWEFAKDEDV